MQCHRQIEELLYEVSILSDSLLAQSDCQASYCQNVRYRDCAPVQIVKSSQFQAVSLLPRSVIHKQIAQSFAPYHCQLLRSFCKNHGFSIQSDYKLCSINFKDPLLNWGKLYRRCNGTTCLKDLAYGCLKKSALILSAHIMCEFPVHTHLYVLCK